MHDRQLTAHAHTEGRLLGNRAAGRHREPAQFGIEAEVDVRVGILVFRRRKLRGERPALRRVPPHGAVGRATLVEAGFAVAGKILHEAAAIAQPAAQRLNAPAAHQLPALRLGVEQVARQAAEIRSIGLLNHQRPHGLALLPIEQAHGLTARALAAEALRLHPLAALHQQRALALGRSVGVIAAGSGIPHRKDGHAHGAPVGIPQGQLLNPDVAAGKIVAGEVGARRARLHRHLLITSIALHAREIFQMHARALTRRHALRSPVLIAPGHSRNPRHRAQQRGSQQ